MAKFNFTGANVRTMILKAQQEKTLEGDEYVEYNQATETALIQINVEITQENSVCTSAFAVYRKKIQMLELSGSPRVTESDNVFRAQEIVFNLDTKEITLDGKVSGTVIDKKENGGTSSESGT